MEASSFSFSVFLVVVWHVVFRVVLPDTDLAADFHHNFPSRLTDVPAVIGSLVAEDIRVVRSRRHCLQIEALLHAGVGRSVRKRLDIVWSDVVMRCAHGIGVLGGAQPSHECCLKKSLFYISCEYKTISVILKTTNLKTPHDCATANLLGLRHLVLSLSQCPVNLEI